VNIVSIVDYKQYISQYRSRDDSWTCLSDGYLFTCTIYVLSRLTTLYNLYMCGQDIETDHYELVNLSKLTTEDRLVNLSKLTTSVYGQPVQCDQLVVNFSKPFTRNLS